MRSTSRSQVRSSSISLCCSASMRHPSGRPAAIAAASITSKSFRLVSAVSFPPFKTAQLPLLRHREEIWTSASGLASKMTPMTPIGHVILVR